MVQTYPEIDCVVLNSGIQRTLDFTQPEAIDLARAQLELTTNYTAPMHLLKHLLPHLRARAPRPAAVVAVTSGLALVPLPRCGGYCATKAALRSLLWSLRAQLAADPATRDHLRVVEILPPAVQTELHALQPELRARGPTDFGMPLAAFVDDAWAGLVRSDEEIPVGTVKERWYQGEGERRKAFDALVEAMGTT